jgi:hypothetical protein
MLKIMAGHFIISKDFNSRKFMSLMFADDQVMLTSDEDNDVPRIM